MQENYISAANIHRQRHSQPELPSSAVPEFVQSCPADSLLQSTMVSTQSCAQSHHQAGLFHSCLVSLQLLTPSEDNSRSPCRYSAATSSDDLCGPTPETALVISRFNCIVLSYKWIILPVFIYFNHFAVSTCHIVTVIVKMV